MRIAIVQALYPLSGAGAAAKDLARGLAARHDVHFLRCGAADAEHHEDGHRVVTFGLDDPDARWRTYFNPPIVRKLAAELARLKPDVVQFNTLQNNTFSLGSLLLARTYRTFWMMHDLWAVCVKSYPEPPGWTGYRSGCLVCKKWPVISIVNRVLKEAVYLASPLTVMTPSRWLAGEVASTMLVRRRPVKVVELGIDTRLFTRRTDARAALGLDPARPLVVFVGGKYMARKGIDHLVDALGPDPVDTLVLGGLPHRPLPPWAKVVGAVPREMIPLYYSAADVVAVPSLQEIFGLTVLEAAACETPVVAYATDGIPELIVPEKTGVLVPTGDRAGLGLALRALLADPARRRAMGQAGRAWVEERFTLDAYVARAEAAFAEGLDAGR